ncbi:helix-turn-helix transcriptional regulator [Shouchella lonarensis]|uniref:Putative transcriptional regulator n=1 Tax=Shouchella lonarensis TaxID=1464122 RepID=A0A1G6LGU4_9BACI|nr:helix-turn-helix transcriptional regulator [Shouchella lonarensis]SDC41975.1 putative transcriptional regulator [Shouchella lonarensis]
MWSELKRIRLQHKMTLKDVAQAIGVSTPFYWQIENRKRGLSYEVAYKISTVFSLYPDDIFLQTVKQENQHNP